MDFFFKACNKDKFLGIKQVLKIHLLNIFLRHFPPVTFNICICVCVQWESWDVFFCFVYFSLIFGLVLRMFSNRVLSLYVYIPLYVHTSLYMYATYICYECVHVCVYVYTRTHVVPVCLAHVVLPQKDWAGLVKSLHRKSLCYQWFLFHAQCGFLDVE